ncbi:hypothetical protein DV738_g1851, partial [Chaetothyriales sp. CBS 135597]
MGTPRRSARVAAQDSTPNYTEDDLLSGRKRKSEAAATSSPSAKRGKKSTSKKDQKAEKAAASELDRQADEKPEPVGDAVPAPAPAQAEPEAPAEDEKAGAQDAIADEPKEPEELVKSDVAAETAPQITADASAVDGNAPPSEVADQTSTDAKQQNSDEDSAKHAPLVSDLPSRTAGAVPTQPDAAASQSADVAAEAAEAASASQPAAEHHVNGTSAPADKPATGAESSDGAPPAPPADQTDPAQSVEQAEKASDVAKN